MLFSTLASLSDQDVASLVQAATDAAQAGGVAVAAPWAQQAGRACGVGFQKASKVGGQPERESHKDDLAKWQGFKVNFNAGLYYGNKRFEPDVHRPEVVRAEQPTTNVDGQPSPWDFQEQLPQVFTSCLAEFSEFTAKDRPLLNQVLGLEPMPLEYARSSGTGIAGDKMLSVLVRALPQAN